MATKTTTTPKAAAVYCRISKDLNGSGLGVARQEKLCRDLADQKGWPVARVYVDNDLSAYSGKRRPEYEAMCADLEGGVVDAVVTVDQDRLTRNPIELETFIILADRLGVPLANVSGDLDLGTSDGRFRARIMGDVARHESEKKSERLRRQKDQAATMGAASGGPRRYGYLHARNADDQPTLEIVESEAAVVRDVASRFLAGESLRQIALDLNTRGVPTVRGGTWKVTTLTTVISGPHITGLRVHRSEVVGDGDWPPILDRATWEQVRSVLGDPRRTKRGRPPTRLLTGMLRCGKCGAGLSHSTRPGGGRRYVCHPTAGTDNCGRLAVTAEPVEAEVTGQALAALASPALYEALDTTPDVDAAAVVRQMEADELALDQLSTDHYVDRRISRREFLAARDALTKRIAEHRVAIAGTTTRSVPDDLPRSLDDLETRWDQLDMTARRRILEAVIDHVQIGPGQPGSKRFDPSRVTIAWRA